MLSVPKKQTEGKRVYLPIRKSCKITFEYLAAKLGFLGVDGAHITALEPNYRNNTLVIYFEDNTGNHAEAMDAKNVPAPAMLIDTGKKVADHEE